jgi:DNA-binding XRE family transcriptional regulator
MKNMRSIPRILKIESIRGMEMVCLFTNGQSRKIDFEKLFQEWEIKKGDVEFPLVDPKKLAKVELRNNTLSWPDIKIIIPSPEGGEMRVPYEIGPDVLFEHSQELVGTQTVFVGDVIREARKKAGLTQAQLAMRSGTTRFYISKLENNKSDVELSTVRKIVEAGLGKRLHLVIE